jgi:hypothetical protein
MGRSGSTLLLNILNHGKKYREIFEPFFPDRVKEAKDFIYPQYISPEDRDPKYLKPANRIFSGRIRNSWTDRFNQKVFVKKRIIKDIRINLFLKWIRINFPRIPIILLFRNPFATVHSWREAGFGDGSLARKRILGQDSLVKSFLGTYKKEYMMIQGEFERLIFFWCIYYLVPLRQFSPNEIYITFYENYFLEPEREIKKMMVAIGDSYNDDILEILNRPSATVRLGSEVLRQRGDMINGWKNHVSDVQRAKGLDILTLFGMQNIYNRESEPDMDEVLKLTRQP